MTTPAQGQPADNVGGTGDNGGGGEKPYANYLAELPESMRSSVEPIFQKWDADVTQRFQKLHSETDPYKPFIEQWEPEALEAATAMLVNLQQDPRGFYDALAQNFGFAEQGQTGANGNGSQPQTPTPSQQQQQVPTQQDIDLENNPIIKQMLEQQMQLAQVIQTQQQQAEMAQAEMAFNQMMGALHAKYDAVGPDGTPKPGFDDAYVTTLIAQGMEPEKAVEQFRGMITNFGAPAAPAPMVLGPGGGLPSNYVDPAKMSSADRLKYVTERLAQAAKSV